MRIIFTMKNRSTFGYTLAFSQFTERGAHKRIFSEKTDKNVVE